MLFAILSVAALALSTVTLNTPLSNTFITGNYTLNATTDDSNTTNVSFYYYNGSITLIGSNTTNSTSYTFVWDTSTVTDAMYNISANATNASNANATVMNYNITVDNTYPTISVYAPTDSGYIADATTTLFNISLTEQNLDLTKNVTIYFKNSGAGTFNSDTLQCTGTAPNYWCSKTINLDAYVGDASTLQFFFNTTDKAGLNNTNGTSSSPLTATIDETAPVITALNAPSDASWATNKTIMFNFTAEDTNPDTCALYHNETSWHENLTMSWTNNTATNFTNVTFTSDGYYKWNVLCNDSAGNTAWYLSNFTLNIDTSAPTATLDAPSNSTWDADGTVTISYTPTDTNLANCTLYHNFTGTWTANETNNSLTSGVQINNTFALSDGYYMWNVMCNDSAGNSAFNSSGNFTINVDNTDPVVNTIDNYANNTWATSKTLTFGVNATDINPANCTLYHNISGTWTANQTIVWTSQDDTNFSALTIAADTTFMWNVMCNDSAGQQTWFSSNYTINVDSANPSIALNSPATNTWDNDGSILFSYTPTDTNLQTCILYHNATGSWAANNTNTSLASGVQINNSWSLSDGYYSWNALCNDSAGNTAWAAANFTINVDTSAPTVTMDVPATNTWDTDGTITISYTPTDTNIANCTLYHNISGTWTANQTNTSLTSGVQVNNTFAVSDGYYMWNVLCNDSADNSAFNSTGNFTINVDSSSPTATLDAPSTGTWDTDGTITISYTPTDTNIDACTLYANFSGSWTMNQTNTSLTSGTQVNNTFSLSDGYYEWNTLCNDSAGNSALNSTANYTINIDSTNPNIKVYAPAISGYIADATTTLFNISLTEQNLNDSINVTVYYKDSGAGAYTAATLGCTGTAPNHWCSSTINLDAHVGDGSTLQFFFNTTDKAGLTTTNGSSASPLSATVDETSPVVNTINNYVNNSWQTTNTLTFGFNVTDTNIDTCVLYHNDSGTWNANVSISSITSQANTSFSETTILPNSFYKWNVLCNDSAGNTAWYSSNFTLNIDTSAPTATLDAPASASWDTDGTVTLSYTPIDTNIGNCTLYHNFTGTWTSNETNNSLTSGVQINNTFALSDGYYMWNVMCNDSAGNSAFNSTANFTINVDTNNLAVNTLNNYANNTWITTKTATFGFNATDTNLQTCVLYHNASGSWAANVSTSSITSQANTNFSSITFGSDTTIIWNVLCNDSAGNTAWYSSNFTLNIDSTVPTVTLDVPADTSWDSDGTVLFSYTPTDTNLQTCILYHNATGSWAANNTNTSLTSGVQINNSWALTDGPYQWNAYCNDSAGNTAWAAANYTFSVDTDGLTVNTLNNYADDAWSDSNTITFGFNATDSNPGTCALYHNASGWAENITTSWTSNADTNLSSITLADGHYIWNVLCNDTAGNTDWFTTNYTLHVDSANPSTTLDYPVNNARLNTSTVTFSYTPTDINIDTCILYHNFSTAWAANETNSSLTSGVQVNNTFTLADGTYIWNAWCNDSANHGVFNGTNFTVTIDATIPTLSSWIYSESTQIITLTFSETMDASSIDVSKINLTNSDNSDRVNLLGATASTTNSTSITITVTNGQATSIVALTATRNITLEPAAIKDLAANPIALTNIAVGTYTSSDTTVPTVTFTAPNGTVTSATQIINVTTNENATCKFDEADQAYNTMTYTMTGSATDHNYTMASLSDGDYNYYVRCNDTAGNVMTTSAAIAFTVNAVDETPPSITGTSPAGLITDDTPELLINSSENSTCKFGTADVAYGSMTYTMTADGAGTSHNYTFASALTDSDLNGDYVYYVRCQDISSNAMTTSSFISFVLDTDGNYNYTQWLYPIWDTLWLPDTSILNIMGYTDYNLSYMLNNSRFLHNNSYTNVYYYNGSHWAGYNTAVGQSGSDLQYVNNTNDKPYWMKLNSTVVSIKTRFQI